MIDPRIPPIPYREIAEDIADSVFDILDKARQKKIKLPSRRDFRAVLVGTVAKYIEGHVDNAYRKLPQQNRQRMKNARPTSK